MRPGLETCLSAIGELPVDVLQAMFASLNPYMTTDKFRRFADMTPGSQAARDFVAVEDWLNDGVPLAAPIARECLFQWYLENAPARGVWQVGGDPVRPEDVTVPALVVIPKGDTIVPPASAEALAQALPNARSMSLSGGHIGMMVGRRAPSQLYGPLADWLKDAAV
jgi:polyhydroxyalkanoate synthase